MVNIYININDVDATCRVKTKLGFRIIDCFVNKTMINTKVVT